LLSLNPQKRGPKPKKFVDCKDKNSKIRMVKTWILEAVNEIFQELDDADLEDTVKLLFLKGLNKFLKETFIGYSFHPLPIYFALNISTIFDEFD
jgi:hypothetical protein